MGLGLQTWSRHHFPGNPLLAAPCSEWTPAPSGLALPAGKRRPVHRQCAPRGSHLRSAPAPRFAPCGVGPLCPLPVLPSAPTRPCQSAVTLAGACSPGADYRAVCQPPSPRHPIRASRLSSVFQQVPLFIFGQWVSLPLSSPEHLLAAKLPGAVSVRYRFNLTSPEYVGLDQGSADCGLGANLAALCAAHKPGIVSYF